MSIKSANVCFLGDASSLQAANFKRLFRDNGKELHVFDCSSSQADDQNMRNGVSLSNYYQKLFGASASRRKALIEYLDRKVLVR